MQTYSGKALTPAVEVSLENGNVLKEGSDYTVSYADNTEIGTAKVTVSAAGTSAVITGSVTVDFEIGKTAIADALCLIKQQPFTGLEIKPVPQLKYKGQIIDENLYTLRYENNVDKGIGTAKIIVTAKENSDFSGEKIIPFNIVDNTIFGADKENIKGEINFDLSQSEPNQVVGYASGYAVTASQTRLVLLSASQERKEDIQQFFADFSFDGKTEILQTAEIRLFNSYNQTLKLKDDIKAQIRFPYPEGQDKSSVIEVLSFPLGGGSLTNSCTRLTAVKYDDYFQFEIEKGGLLMVSYSKQAPAVVPSPQPSKPPVQPQQTEKSAEESPMAPAYIILVSAVFALAMITAVKLIKNGGKKSH